jgi:hypothetical protein
MCKSCMFAYEGDGDMAREFDKKNCAKGDYQCTTRTPAYDQSLMLTNGIILSPNRTRRNRSTLPNTFTC